ncbi:sulfurtransferase [Sulfurimonas sp. NW15]|uniref:sulfurtransferase n=1 Tax=unclassified Sulfurimonas TaxID=2623549 RepID=UPI003DA808EC
MNKTSLILVAATLAVSLEAGTFSNFFDRVSKKGHSIKVVRGLNHDQKSYKDNEYGLVNADVAAKWINDWEANKPAGVNGRLFVMQVGLLPGSKPFVKHDDVHVFTFDRTAGCTTTGDIRNDGISDIPMPIFSGGMTGMDGAFWAYDINPNEDMLLVVVASDDPQNMALASRFLWTMSYWGMKEDHVSLMNGTAMYMFDPELNPRIKRAGVTSKESMFTEMGSEYLMAPGGKLDFGDAKSGRAPAQRQNFESIKTLPTQPNFSLFASMEDIMNVVDANQKSDVIIDGRSAAEYNAEIEVKRSKTETKECGVNHDKQCYSAFEGHIRGAVNLEYRSVINTQDFVKDLNGDGIVDERDASMTFLSKRELKRTFRKLGVKRDSDVYTYCRTGTRASLVTFASYEILGYKTHMYDGSWIQWSKLADAVDTYAKQMLPEDSPWRTDVSRYTENIKYNDSVDVGPASATLYPYAPEGSGNRIVEEDEAYRFDF